MPDAPKKWLATNKSSCVLITLESANTEFQIPEPIKSVKALREKKDQSM